MLIRPDNLEFFLGLIVYLDIILLMYVHLCLNRTLGSLCLVFPQSQQHRKGLEVQHKIGPMTINFLF